MAESGNSEDNVSKGEVKGSRREFGICLFCIDWSALRGVFFDFCIAEMERWRSNDDDDDNYYYM